MNYTKAEQVKFLDSVNDEHYGILLNEIVICGCCGGVYNVKEIKIVEILPWITLEEEIKGD